MEQEKKKAAEEERRHKRLVKIANMKFDNEKKKIKITYFSNPLEKAPDRHRICPLSILPCLKPLD